MSLGERKKHIFVIIIFLIVRLKRDDKYYFNQKYHKIGF